MTGGNARRRRVVPRRLRAGERPVLPVGAECSRRRHPACEAPHELPPRWGWILGFMSTTERPRILVVGGGYVGLYAARRILKKMRYGEATVTVVDPRS